MTNWKRGLQGCTDGEEDKTPYNFTMLIFLLALLTQPTSSFATTKAEGIEQPSSLTCSIRAKFLGVTQSRIPVIRNGHTHQADTVHWILDVQSVSDNSICPLLGKVSLRIRGASFRSLNDPRIAYPMGVTKPEKRALVSLKVAFAKGQDTFTKKDYEEWFLKELLVE